jgi:purine-nucleoside phosphorylase
MSTVPEVVAARDEGMRVLVLSLVTNLVVGVEQATRGRSVREELDAEVRNRNIAYGELPRKDFIFIFLVLSSRCGLSI